MLDRNTTGNDVREEYSGLWVLVQEQKRRENKRWMFTDKQTAKESGEMLYLNEQIEWDKSIHSERETMKVGSVLDTYVEPLTLHDEIPSDIKRENERKRETTPGFDTK